MANIFAYIEIKTINPLSFSHHGYRKRADGSVPLPTMIRGINEIGEPLRTVYWPAAALRGALRHGAALADMQKGSKATLKDAYLLALGQDLEREESEAREKLEAQTTGKKADKKPQDVLATNADRARVHPVLDLFGTWKMPSRLQVSNLLPVINVAPDRFSYVRRDLDTNPELFDLLAPEDHQAFYDRQQRQAEASRIGEQIDILNDAIKAAGKAKDAALKTELEAKRKALDDLKVDAKGDDQSGNSKHLLTVECIPAGLVLQGKLVLQRAKPRDLDILLHGLDTISRKPLFGAHTARGLGEIEATARFTDGEGDVLCVVQIGGYQSARQDWTETGVAYKNTAPLV